MRGVVPGRVRVSRAAQVLQQRIQLGEVVVESALLARGRTGSVTVLAVSGTPRAGSRLGLAISTLQRNVNGKSTADNDQISYFHPLSVDNRQHNGCYSTAGISIICKILFLY
jgi:hypothetical protein